MPAHREEVLNTVLAACLATHGVDAEPETILRRGRSRPDVMIAYRGLRCAIEGKVADAANAEAQVLDDARGRVEQGITHLAVAVIYAKPLRGTDFALLPAAINHAEFKFAVLTDGGHHGWQSGGVNAILAELRRAHEILVRDDVLQQAVDTLSLGLDEVSSVLMNSAATCDRLIKVLGVGSKASADASV